ncbi:MAG: hypothetical protein K8S13_16210 [Desulfobacula sp.]|uniref:hypothetical protein n=1 Tax=Desulfobacula sp. TaxID=2593537 RepID=UPI0025C03A19|nr:hypothetical protein [Desulfobacula sp.]MCD4721383.1 hypothetical protein [Desulfobacula sp.]
MKPFSKTRKYIYFITLFFITLTGFGQMPIFKRYYIADIPGLGWLAQFYITNRIHYTFAIVLIALAVYVVADYFFSGKRHYTISTFGYLKLFSISGLIVSGAFMVVKNLPNVYFPHTFVIAIDLTHIVFCMLLLGASFYTLVMKKKWVN